MTRLTNRSTARPMVAFAALFAFLLLLTACGGGTTPSTTTDGGGTDAPAAQTSAATEAAPDAGGGNGSGITDFCLNTVEEVAAAFEVEGVEATGNEAPGIGGGCAYIDAEGTSVYAISVITADNSFAAARANASEDVSGIGDEAVYIQVSEAFFSIAFRKGDVTVSVGPLGLDELLDGDLARQRAATEDLARMAADRL